MRLLLDNNLSIRLGDFLAKRVGTSCTSARSGCRPRATASFWIEPEQNVGVLVSADTDSGALLAASHESGPSVVLVRRVANRRADELAGILLANLPPIVEDLDHGCIVVIGEDSLRIRPLPIG